ncbi:pollen-specific leucine-rich repeat extensin-like protein 2 [Micropterus salmoides]|uniref:pollen-specific leucine-rich repeat extensin-like protein 2 n=1 Tax=Micropterus salmoides TaxID=27706 RepID=UPI0018EDAFD0|nr:pollen-specific leucine-rich repeat extensin-like protein 2 [Micropterus salmoides]
MIHHNFAKEKKLKVLGQVVNEEKREIMKTQRSLVHLSYDVHSPSSPVNSAGLTTLPSSLGPPPRHPLPVPSQSACHHTPTTCPVSSPVPPLFLGPRCLPAPLSQSPRLPVFPASASPSPPLPQPLFRK